MDQSPGTSSSNRKRVALVIGSGGAKCAAALGLWQVLEEEGIQVSMAVGSSGGSIYAAVMALDFDVQTARELTLSLWTRDLMEGYATNLRRAMTGEVRFSETSGLIDDYPLMERLSQAFGSSTFEDTRMPLYIVSTDFHTGESVVHSNGRILEAVRASIAIPMIIPPWQGSERLLVDGAVSDPLPVDVAIKEGAEVILAMGFELPTRKRLRSYTAVTAHLNSLYMNNILKATFAFHNLAHHAEVLLVLPELDSAIGAFSAEQFPEVIAEGARSARAQLPYLRRLLG
jgi:NTE family protein